MKMDGSSKRKLSKRKDPELALTYYKAEGFPVEAVYEYIMTLLNSNYEDWRRANPTAPATEFKFSPKKLNPAGNLFDYAKLTDVSKNEIAKMSAEKAYTLLTEWANEFDPDFGAKLSADPAYATAILAIGRGGKKPWKDLATWKDAKEYMGFFYDEYLAEPVFPERFSVAVIAAVLEKFAAVYDPADDSATWFEKVKTITTEVGFTTDMKAYKADPRLSRHRGRRFRFPAPGPHRKKKTPPDLYTVMQILGKGRSGAYPGSIEKPVKRTPKGHRNPRWPCFVCVGEECPPARRWLPGGHQLRHGGVGPAPLPGGWPPPPDCPAWWRHDSSPGTAFPPYTVSGTVQNISEKCNGIIEIFCNFRVTSDAAGSAGCRAAPGIRWSPAKWRTFPARRLFVPKA